MSGISLVPIRELGIAANWDRLAEATGVSGRFATQTKFEAPIIGTTERVK